VCATTPCNHLLIRIPRSSLTRADHQEAGEKSTAQPVGISLVIVGRAWQ